MDIESDLKKINITSKRDGLNRNFSSVFEGFGKNMTSSGSGEKKLGVQRSTRPVSAYAGGVMSKNHSRKFTQDENPVARQLSLQDRGTGTLKDRKTNPSFCNLSEQSTDAPHKINKHGIINKWIQDRYNQFEKRQEVLLKKHVQDQMKKKQELNRRSYMFKQEGASSVFTNTI